MDINSLKTDHPELYAKVLSLGKTEATSDIDKGIEAARQEERTRTVGILEAGGDPKVTLEAIKTGASAGDTYKKFFEAEKGNKAAALNAMNEEAPDALDIEEPAASADKAVGFNAEVNKLIEAGSSRAAAVKAVAKSNPKLHQAYVEKLGG